MITRVYATNKMPFHPRGKKSFFKNVKTWKKYPRTRYKSTAWRRDAWAFLKKKNRQHGGTFARNALERLRANRHAKNMWAAQYPKFTHVKFAPPGRARNAQADWRWRNR